MKNSLSLLVLVSVVFAVGAVRAEDEAREGARWTLTLEHGPLRIVVLRQAPGRSATYHYMHLKVTNPTKLPRDWFPVVKALTDTNKTYVAMGYEEALGTIRSQERNNDLVSIGTTRGKIQPGETIDTVAIFGPVDPLYDRIKIRLLGLSDPIAIYKVEKYPVSVEVPEVVYKQAAGEGAFDTVTEGVTIQDVAYVERNEKTMVAMRKEAGEGDLPESTVEYWEVSERRVFEMIYVRPGDEFRPDDDLITFEREHWRVVGDVKLLRQIEM